MKGSKGQTKLAITWDTVLFTQDPFTDDRGHHKSKYSYLVNNPFIACYAIAFPSFSLQKCFNSLRILNFEIQSADEKRNIGII